MVRAGQNLREPSSVTLGAFANRTVCATCDLRALLPVEVICACGKLEIMFDDSQVDC